MASGAPLLGGADVCRVADMAFKRFIHSFIEASVKHLQEHIAGIKVTVADALAVDVRHARGNAYEYRQGGLPACGHVGKGKEPVLEGIAQGAAVAELLHAHQAVSTGVAA